MLEASAGTGKTSVLVARYVNLLKAGRRPGEHPGDHLHPQGGGGDARADRCASCAAPAEQSELDRTRWLELRDRLGDIAISTIDAFCLSLLREFPLEADVDPGFDLADETEVPRLDRHVARPDAADPGRPWRASDPDVALVLAQLGISRTRDGLATLLDRRLVAWDALDRFLARGPRDLDVAADLRAPRPRALDDALADDSRRPRRVPGGRSGRASALRAVPARRSPARRVCATRRRRTIRVGARAGQRPLPDQRRQGAQGHDASTPTTQAHYPSRDAMKRHRDAVFAAAPRVEAGDVRVQPRSERRARAGRAADVRASRSTSTAGRSTSASVLDFSDVLQRALELLRQMDEFSQSRFRLESRYHHVLVDEFQDTSRAQWELVSLLVQAWGEGLGARRQPLDLHRRRSEAVDLPVPRRRGRACCSRPAEYIDGLRPDGRSRRSIARSFRAVPELLHFVNDLFTEMSQPDGAPSEFTYDERDRFPVDATVADADGPHEPVLGVAVAETPEECAAAVADEIATILDGRRPCATRPPASRAPRAGRRHRHPVPLAIEHREFERELNARGIPTLRLQRTRLLRRRRNQGCRRADSLSRRSVVVTCARRRSCARASSGCPIAALTRLAPDAGVAF